MTISELYKKAQERGVLTEGLTEDMFRQQISNEEGLKSFYDIATEGGKMKFHPYDVFKERIGWDQEFATPSMVNQPSVINNPAPTNAQEDSINIANQNAGSPNYTLSTPPLEQTAPQPNYDFSNMSYEELQAKKDEMVRVAEEKRRQEVEKAKQWEEEHPFLNALTATRGLGAAKGTKATVVQQADVSMFMDDHEEWDAVKEEWGKRQYEVNYNNIGQDVAGMQKYVSAIPRENKRFAEKKDLDKAEYILHQAELLASAPSKHDVSRLGIQNFGKGFADNFNRDLIPAVELIRDVNINKAVKKMNNQEELTEGETALILAYITYSDVQQARSYDLPMGYEAGAMAAESIPFMVEMLLTQGASTLAVGQVVRIMKAAGKTIDQINDFAKWMNLGAKGITIDGITYGAIEEGAKRTAGSVARNVTKELVGTTLQTAAMPSTYASITEKNMQQRLETGNNEIGFMQQARNFTDAWVQTGTERFGGQLIDDALGYVMPFDKIWRTKAGKQMVANQFFQSPVAETLEEYLAAIMDYGRSFNPLYSEESNKELKQGAQEMFTAEGFGKTFLSMLPNTLVGGSINLYNVHKATNDYEEARADIYDYLLASGATEEQAKNILINIETSDPETMDEKFGVLYSHFNIQDPKGKGAQAAEKYIQAAQAYQFGVQDLANQFESLTDEQKEQAKQEMQQFTAQVKQEKVSQTARRMAQEQAANVVNDADNMVYQVTRADGSTPEGTRTYIASGTIATTTDAEGNVMIDRTQSGESVFVISYDAEGNVSDVEQVATDELDLVFAPESRKQVEDEIYALAMDQYNMDQQLQQEQSQQPSDVVGEESAPSDQQSTENEQASEVEGIQFTNGQQTITASKPDSNGMVRLSSPITLDDGSTATVVPAELLYGLMKELGFSEVYPDISDVGQTYEAATNIPETTDNTPADASEVPASPAIPATWSDMDAEQTIASVVERSNGNKQRAKQFAERQVSAKQKALAEAQKAVDDVAADDIDAFNAAQDKVDAIQAEVDKWTEVANGIDAYNAPVQEVSQPEQSEQEQPSASANVEVAEDVEEQQNTSEGENKITRDSVRELLSKEAKEMEKVWNHNEMMDDTDATEIAHDIFTVLGANVHSMMREEIDDYVGEYYPTQATISSETNSEKGKKEREQLKNDINLKALEDAVKAKQAELDAIVEETRKMIKEICTSPDATAQDIAELLEALARYERRVSHLHEQSGSMSNYDMLDKYIGTTKAFQKDVKMLYDRKNVMANASAKVKEVIELADKASEVVGDKDKFTEAYKRKEEALNTLTLEELEQLKDVLRITGMNDFLYQDAEKRVAYIREEQRRQKKMNSLSDIFDNGGTQVDRPSKVKPYKYNPFDFAANDPVRPVMGTAYHEDGHVVSTDAYILVAVKQKYDKKLEGKMTDKDGKVVLESSKFPNWKLVFNNAKARKTDVTAISVDDFRSFLEGAKAKLKAEWQAKKDNGERVGSFKDYLYNKADVMIRTNGGVHVYRLGRMMDFANALSVIGAKEVFFDGRNDSSAQPMIAETDQGKAMIMPILVEEVSIEEEGRVVLGNSNTAFLYDLADKNTRMSANNSQNILQNEKKSVPLQGEKSATQKVIDKIDSKHFPVVVFNKKNYREVMRKAGASEKLIKEVEDVLSDLKPHQVMGGFFDEGMIFIQEQTDLDEVRKAYIHERQHALNTSNEQLLLKMASTSYKSQFAAMIRAMAGNNFYDKYGMKYLVDEFICRAMEIAYSVETDAELEAELRKIGANDKQIQIIKEINNEQRNDNSLSNARYNSLLDSNDSSRSKQVRRDSQSVSRGVLGEKGNGSAQIGERRDRRGRPSETIGETAKNFTAEQTLSDAGEQVSDKGVRYNIASNDKVVAARETQLKRSVRNGLLTSNEANEIREFAQAMRVIAETIAQAKKADGSAEFPSFSEWNGLEVQFNANGTPLVSAIKSNGEYPMNIDFAKHCIKRDSTNQVLNKLAQVDPQLFTSLTTDMLVEINQIINKHGLSVPCVGCFVEARRYRSAEYAKSVVDTWNTLVDAVEKGDKAINAAKKKLGGKQSVDKIVEHLRNTPSDNVKISESDIISPNKYGELMTQHPTIPTLLQATQGQNNTHLVVPEAIYYGDVLNLSAENSWDVDAAYEVGGVRLQSFSDFKAKLFFDYCQVLADLASKKLPAHSYTKVPSFAELFGLTGMKINLSLYYTGTGLDADGNYTYSDESMSPEFAFDLQAREGYTDNVGTMAIGVSDAHMWKLLKDANIRSISPYHKSGINPEVAAKLKADEFVDYTNEQNAVTPKLVKNEGENWQDYYARITKRVDSKVPTIGKKVKPEFNLYDDLIDTNSPIQTARNYVEYCQKNGIVPKFPSFVYNQDGSFNEEYYKLLFDFSVYNKDGVYVPQGAVRWAEGSMPNNTAEILRQALEVEESTIAKNQAEVDAVVNDILANVFDTDDLAASESQVRFSVVTDKKKIEELEASEKMKGYRTVILNEDGTFSSPMATGLGNKGKTSAKTSGFELGKWEQSEERPELADESGKINLKPKEGGDTYVDYNPYIHNRLDKINTQFTSAWRKPFLVYIETEIPMSDIESGYHAEKAALSVGVHPWNGGDLVLSRYDKPVRIVPWEEVADAWAEQFDEVTFDIVNPELLPLLHERGVKILPPKKAAKEKALAAYKKWEAENSKPRFSVTAAEDKAYADAVARGDMETAQRMVIEAAKKAMPNTKIVDADGNPMIVYHDTNATELVNIETGENWNDLDWRAKDEWRNREDFDEYWEERDFYTFNNLRSRRSIEMPAYFFSTKEDEYHEYGDRTIRAFLNITNPAIDPTIENRGTYDYAGEDAMNRLIGQGYDGFIRTTDNGEWDEVNAFFPNQIKSAEPVTYDDNGDVIPLSERFNNDESDIRFSLSNVNQRIFVSNAERAVESIKQEKATPQQWKAMIEKQGGLKAGEDKWLGLSDWLDSKVAPAQENETIGDVARRVAKNSITKQEILDYIAEHQIQIEDVQYMDADDVTDIDLTPEQQEKYDQFVDEYKTIQEEDGLSEEEAFEELVSRYGEDFTMAFFVDSEGELQIQGDYYGGTADAALYYLGGEQARAINSTRLEYTTKGLENKREIALVVPTIESWNEGDNIHFGDAGEGRAIAWVRFGEAKVISKPKELEKAEKEYSDFSRRMIRLYGLAYSERIMSDSEIKEQDELLAKLRQAQTEHPKVESKVLVIDEIQSKRHQEGREKGYKASIEKLQSAHKAFKDVEYDYLKHIDFIVNKYSDKGEFKLDYGLRDIAPEEAQKYRELQDSYIKLRREYDKLNYGVPSAPFDKNWHELAFKRMLRYAAENGFDYVAWTTGEQQAERYNLGKHFDSIEREDNPSINGRRFALNGANYFTFVVNDEGIVTDSDMSEIKGKPLADVVGKDLAIRMMSLEDGDAIDFVDLRIGGEGMKGFYDKMLPSFVSKYTKKWGAKVQDINLPSLEESAQTMHAVNVTQEMKDSVMEGQPMFSISAINNNENLRKSEKSRIFADLYEVPEIIFEGDPALDDNTIDNRWGNVMSDIESQGDNVDSALLYEKAGVIADYIDNINKYEQYPVAVVQTNNDLYDWMVSKGVSEEMAINAQRKLSDKGGNRIRGFHQNGTIFILSQNMDSLEVAKLTYAHEMQHAENKRKADLLIKVLDLLSRREALDFIGKFGKRNVYEDLLNKGAEGYYKLADEVVAYAMSEGYKLGMNGNLAEHLRNNGITNEELINILNEEYERQKNDVSNSRRFFEQRDIESYSRGVTRGTRQDAGDLQSRPSQVEQPTQLEPISRSTQGDRGRVAEQARDAVLRVGAKLLAKKYERNNTPIGGAVRFSVNDAPIPDPEETTREYTQRFIEWRNQQVEENAKREFVQQMKRSNKLLSKFAKKVADRDKVIDDFEKAIIKQGGKRNVQNSAYGDCTMAAGRTEFQMRKYANSEFKDLVNAIQAIMDSKKLDHIEITWQNMDTDYTDPNESVNGKRLTVRELIGVYCQAMDVKEAKGKDLPDRGEAGFLRNLADANGNPVTYEDIIRMVHDAVLGTNLTKNLWLAINEATKFSLKYQLAAGMINEETYNKFIDREYYVPERGWRERDLSGKEDNYQQSQGSAMNGSPYNAALKKAKGRDSLAADPFAYILSIAETTIMSAEKNRVKQKFLQFVLDNEDIGLKNKAWNVRRIWLVQDENGNAEVSYTKPSDESKIVKGYASESQIKLHSEVSNVTRDERLQHQVIVMKDGVQYVIELENEEVANALNGQYKEAREISHTASEWMRKGVNWMSAINTQLNPVFPIANFLRDFQLALISNLGEQDAKFTANFIKNLGRVSSAVWKHAVNSQIMQREVFENSEMGKYLEEFFREGAQTGYSFLGDIKSLQKEIDKELNKNKFREGTRKAWGGFKGSLSTMSEFSELLVRVAQYVTARESGKSATEAAQMAKEISVNFNRKGLMTSGISRFYSFFNASVQGTNKIFKLLGKSKRARRTVEIACATYFVLGVLNTLLNPDDPEEEIWHSDYTRKTNFLFGQIKIPVANFFRIFYGAGVDLVLLGQKRKTAKQAMFDTAIFTANDIVPASIFQLHNLAEYNDVLNEVEFNPANWVQGSAPSWASPWVDLALNRNFMGGTINDEPPMGEKGMYKRGKYAKKDTKQIYKDIADMVSGGDSAAIREVGDKGGVSGSSIEHVVEGYIGGSGDFILGLVDLIVRAANQEKIDAGKVPFVNKFYKPYDSNTAYRKEYWQLYRKLNHYDKLLKDWKKNDPEKYWSEYGSDRWVAYQDLKVLVAERPSDDKNTEYASEDIKKLMEANELWREIR